MAADRNLRLQVILEWLDRLTGPLKSIAGASSTARRDLAETHKQLRSLDALQQQIGKYKAVETRFGADAREYEAKQAQITKLKSQRRRRRPHHKPAQRTRTRRGRDGADTVFGTVIGAIDERHVSMMTDGRSLRIDFGIDLARVDDPAATNNAETPA